MERCDECKFFEAWRPDTWRGWCRIKLPPYMKVETADMIIRNDEGCSLGQPIEEYELLSQIRAMDQK